MALVSLDRAKDHLRVLHSDDDVQIELYRAAAEAIVVEYLDRQVVGEGEVPIDDGILVSPAIIAAILLVLSDLYEFRESDPKDVGDAVLPRAVRALLAPYRVWRTVDDDVD